MPTDWLDYTQARIFTTNSTQLERYSFMMYYACLNLGVQELGPVNKIEFIFISLSAIFSSLLNAFFFSDIVVLVKKFQKIDEERQLILDEANHVLKSINLDEVYQEEVR